MFEKIFIEDSVVEHPQTIKILSKFPNVPVKYIEKVEDVFQKTKKPYLQKNGNLNLFIGKKLGALVKEAPQAYGLSGEPHYFFIHSYNCIYECEYCYLQGYFHSPDLVFFVNHDDIAKNIKELAAQAPEGTTPWFHAGEFSDSLALSHLTGELPFYFDLFKDLPNAKLELRTKSANIRELKKLEPLPNIITSFSLAPAHRCRDIDLKTPPLKSRLNAIKELSNLGHKIGIHFDPIIYEDNFVEEYQGLITDLMSNLDLDNLEYISIGIVRFTKDVYTQVKKNYPKSSLLAEDFVSSFDGKVRYNRPLRMWMLSQVKQILLDQKISEAKIYLCME